MNKGEFERVKAAIREKMEETGTISSRKIEGESTKRKTERFLNESGITIIETIAEIMQHLYDKTSLDVFNAIAEPTMKLVVWELWRVDLDNLV